MTQSDHEPAAKCARCGIMTSQRACMMKDGKGSKNCPTHKYENILLEANREYDKDDTLKFAYTASIQEADGYANRDQKPYIMQPTKPRIVEICEFANKMGYQRLGLAFCIGLSKEAGIVEQILLERGFKVISVLCKAGRTPKEMIGVTDKDKIYRGTDEAMCNPIFQAKLLNQSKTDFNIVLGLCVGHDSLFFQNSQAPVTVLAVKDRVTGHNPLAAIYLADSYYRKIRQP